MTEFIIDTVPDFVEAIEVMGYADSWSMRHWDPAENTTALVEGLEPPPANDILWDHKGLHLAELLADSLYQGQYGAGVLVMVSRGAQALRQMRSA